MRNIIEGLRPGEKLASQDELSDLLTSAIDFAKPGELSTESESHAMVRSFYSTSEDRVYTVILFSNDGILDAVSVCEMLPCRHHSTTGEHVIIHQFRQINMTFEYGVETWQFGVNDLGELDPRGISQTVARRMTQLLRSETQPIATQPLSIASPK